jgi:hypothetical protein
MVAQSTPTVLPAAQAETEGDKHIQPICHMLVATSLDLVLDESLNLPHLFLGVEASESFQAFLEEVVHEIYYRYISSQEDLPWKERRMPEAG